MGKLLSFCGVIVLFLTFIALVLSTVKPLSQGINLYARIVVAMQGFIAAGFMGFGVMFAVGMGRAFGGSPTHGDSLVVWLAICAFAYFVAAGISLIWTSLAAKNKTVAYGIHFSVLFLFIVLALCSNRWSMTTYAFLELLYITLWSRFFEEKVRLTKYN